MRRRGRGGIRTRREGRGMTKIVMADLNRRSHTSMDRAGKWAQAQIRQKLRGTRLGGFQNAVGVSSSKKKRQTSLGSDAWAAIFAKGGDKSRAAAALKAYTEGATIMPLGGKKWLAYPGDDIPQKAGRYRMTPELYKSTGLESRIGELRFRPVSGNYAQLLVRRGVPFSNRTGRLRQRTGKAMRGVSMRRDIVAFHLIKYTVRAKRFNQRSIMRRAIRKFRSFMDE